MNIEGSYGLSSLSAKTRESFPQLLKDPES